MSVDQDDVVVEWCLRDGHECADVSLGDRELGYRDLQTGNVHCSNPAFVDLVTRTTAEIYRRAHEPDDYVARHRMPDDEPVAGEPMPSVWEPDAWRPEDGPVLRVTPRRRGLVRDRLRRRLTV